jgi:PAN domain
VRTIYNGHQPGSQTMRRGLCVPASRAMFCGIAVAVLLCWGQGGVPDGKTIMAVTVEVKEPAAGKSAGASLNLGRIFWTVDLVEFTIRIGNVDLPVKNRRGPRTGFAPGAYRVTLPSRLTMNRATNWTCPAGEITVRNISTGDARTYAPGTTQFDLNIAAKTGAQDVGARRSIGDVAANNPQGYTGYDYSIEVTPTLCPMETAAPASPPAAKKQEPAAPPPPEAAELTEPPPWLQELNPAPYGFSWTKGTRIQAYSITVSTSNGDTRSGWISGTSIPAVDMPPGNTVTVTLSSRPQVGGDITKTYTFKVLGEASLSDMTMLGNTEAAGARLSWMFLSDANPAACRAACAANPACRGFVHEKPGSRGPQAYCELKSMVSATTPNNCCTSGIRAKAQPPATPAAPTSSNSAIPPTLGALESDITLKGTILRYFATASTPAVCQSECARDGQCRAFTYVRAGGYGNSDPPMCYLLSEVTGRTNHACCVSSVKSGASTAVAESGVAPVTPNRNPPANVRTAVTAPPSQPRAPVPRPNPAPPATSSQPVRATPPPSQSAARSFTTAAVTPPAGAGLLQTIDITATAAPWEAASGVLQVGRQYVIEAFGTWDYWGNRGPEKHGVDPVWCYAQWRCGAGEVWQSLLIDGKGMQDQSGQKVAYNPAHVYRIYFAGQGRPLKLVINGGHGDMFGGVTVRIYGGVLPSQPQPVQNFVAAFTTAAVTPPAGPGLFETINVTAEAAPWEAVSKSALQVGRRYVIEAFGTWDYWGNKEPEKHGVDPVWCYAQWRCGVGEVWQGLLIDGKGLQDLSGQKIPYNSQHVYRIYLTGQGGPIKLTLNGGHGDMFGGFTVRIY